MPPSSASTDSQLYPAQIPKCAPDLSERMIAWEHQKVGFFPAILFNTEIYLEERVRDASRDLVRLFEAALVEYRGPWYDS